MIKKTDLIKGAQFVPTKTPAEGEEKIVLTFEKFNKFGDCDFIPSDERMKDDDGFFFLPIHIATEHLSKYDK